MYDLHSHIHYNMILLRVNDATTPNFTLDPPLVNEPNNTIYLEDHATLSTYCDVE